MKSSLFLCLALPFLTFAQDQDSQAELRQNPEMESIKTANFVEAKIEYPKYIDLKANKIEMHGDDWSELYSSLLGCDTTRVNILHIGDSHLQADMGTAVTRQRLANHYGHGGRGLTVPFKLAGTNEPVDYAITADCEMIQSRLLKTPWPISQGFSGIAIQPANENVSFKISTRQPFDKITVFYTGEDVEIEADSLGNVERGSGWTTVQFPDTISVCELPLKVKNPCSIHGFNLEQGNSGVNYHVIGNNGATYATYNGLEGFAKQTSQLSPSLIIISLGANEAFGRTTDAEMKSQMLTLISSLRQASPNAKFLLTTPAECQRKTKRRGRKRRRVSYSVNTNIARLRKVILQVAEDQKIPVYDFYAVAGGVGASSKWLNDKYLNTDRIHLTRAGYTLQGHLFTDALEKALISE